MASLSSIYTDYSKILGILKKNSGLLYVSFTYLDIHQHVLKTQNFWWADISFACVTRWATWAAQCVTRVGEHTWQVRLNDGKLPPHYPCSPPKASYHLECRGSENLSACKLWPVNPAGQFLLMTISCVLGLPEINQWLNTKCLLSFTFVCVHLPLRNCHLAGSTFIFSPADFS